MISVSWSLTRQDHGEQPFWAAITLASMLGQIGKPGTGIGFGYSAMNHIGLNRRPFLIYKFRTMKNLGKKIPDIKRMTKLGTFLRRTSLDELPQIINVIIGPIAMSMPAVDEGINCSAQLIK